MSIDVPFTKDNLNHCLSALAKEFRKRNGTAMPVEIVLIGGASVLANYGFRNMTYDVDAVIHASSAMKEAVNCVGDKLGLPSGWLNMDFKNTKSFSHKLTGISVYYKTFSNILTVRTVAAEYLVAMKLMSGRQYKNDMSDIAGIIWEHQKKNNAIAFEAIDRAVEILYDGWAEIPQVSQDFIKDIFESGNCEAIYKDVLANEQSARKAVLAFEEQGRNVSEEGSINAIIEQAKRKKNGMPSVCNRDEE